MEVTTTLPLNQGQTAAADGFFEFLLSDEKEMGITGPGGVGKTFLMGHMIDEIMPRYFDSCKMMGLDPEFETVHMTATTNKAAEVLGQYTGRPTSTVQSFLNLTVYDDFQTGQSVLKKSRNWTVHEKKVLFVDEGSMTDTPLYNMAHEGTIQSKIVWVGDHCQMAPIKEKLSPIYRQGMRTYELSEPMRTNIPELHALNNQLRLTVETGEFKPIKLVPGIIDWADANQMELEIQAHFLGIDIDSRVLGYTNKTVQDLNDYIRELRQLPAMPTVGEILINNTVINLPGYMLSVEEEVTLLEVSPVIKPVWIDNHDGEDIWMDTWNVTIECKLGGVFRDVGLPVDRAFFDQLTKWYKGRKDWGTYYKLKKTFPDLRQRDASTVYKAQGSSLTTVFIDASNLSTCHNPDQAARMLYVAASRARKRVCFYGTLVEKYGGLIL